LEEEDRKSKAEAQRLKEEHGRLKTETEQKLKE